MLVVKATHLSVWNEGSGTVVVAVAVVDVVVFCRCCCCFCCLCRKLGCAIRPLRRCCWSVPILLEEVVDVDALRLPWIDVFPRCILLAATARRPVAAAAADDDDDERRMEAVVGTLSLDDSSRLGRSRK